MSDLIFRSTLYDQNNNSSLDSSAIFRPYHDSMLTSHFQPIYSIAHRRAIGYEGLVRAKLPNGSPQSPAELFALPDNGQEMLELDRLCRTLHIENFTRQHSSHEWLFINLNGQSLISEQPDIGFTQRLINTSGLPPHRLVIEILENEIHDLARLQHFIDYFRQLGCLIAIDDFGAGHSNFDRIWQLEPDIVKIDRNLVRQAGLSKRVERILSGIIALLHEAGSLVVLEGIETELEANVAIAANADMMQGFYFARPAAELLPHTGKSNKIDLLLNTQRHRHTEQRNTRQQETRLIQQLFQRAVCEFTQHKDLQQSSAQLFSDPRTARSYLLDEAGCQITNSIYAPSHHSRIELRFAPLLCGNHANWSHRPYHYRALERPGTTYVSKPYLSVADSQMCVTLSQAFRVGNDIRVFCCDLDWNDDA
jgi:EAL domain-containing protein (putative c-di-GMP-specific phosphodiesterase class I)